MRTVPFVKNVAKYVIEIVHILAMMDSFVTIAHMDVIAAKPYVIIVVFNAMYVTSVFVQVVILIVKNVRMMYATTVLVNVIVDTAYVIVAQIDVMYAKTQYATAA